jgi:redox-sensitive bicupin YhaK (pirin superfamily)
VNLPRKDKQVEPSARVLLPEEIAVRKEGDAIVRRVGGRGDLPSSSAPPATVLDVELPSGGNVTMPVPPEFQGFAYLLDGSARFGANERGAIPPQLVLLRPPAVSSP